MTLDSGQYIVALCIVVLRGFCGSSIPSHPNKHLPLEVSILDDFSGFCSFLEGAQDYHMALAARKRSPRLRPPVGLKSHISPGSSKSCLKAGEL